MIQLKRVSDLTVNFLQFKLARKPLKTQWVSKKNKLFVFILSLKNFDLKTTTLLCEEFMELPSLLSPQIQQLPTGIPLVKRRKNLSITYKKTEYYHKLYFFEWLTIKIMRDLSRARLRCCETVISLYRKMKIIVMSLSRLRVGNKKQCEMKCYSGYQITNDCLRFGLWDKQSMLGRGRWGLKAFQFEHWLI